MLANALIKFIHFHSYLESSDPKIVHERAKISPRYLKYKFFLQLYSTHFLIQFSRPVYNSSFLPSREKLSSFYKRLLLTRRTRKRYPFPSRVARNRHGTKTSLSSSRISPLSPIDCVRLRAIVPLYPLASSPRFRPRLPTRVFPDYERLRSSSRTMAGGRGTALYPILKIYARINGNCRFQTPREGNVEIRGGAHLCPVERPSSPRKIARKLEKKNNKDTG